MNEIKTVVIEAQTFQNLIEKKKFRSVQKAVEKEIIVLKDTNGRGQRLFGDLFEKRLKDDFRLFYFRFEFENKLFIVLVMLLLTDKKNQQKEIDFIRENYKEMRKMWLEGIKEKFKF